MVPGLTDAWDNVAAVGAHLSGMANVERVEVLPFEQTGREVWHSLGTEYRLEVTEEPDGELIERVRTQLLASGLPVV